MCSIWTPAKSYACPSFPRAVIGNLRWHENNRDLAFSLNTSQSPSDVYSVDVQSAKLDRWTMSETGGIQPQNFVEPKLIKWKSFDGREISGWLYLPKDKPATGKYPVEIVIHGGPEGQSRPDLPRTHQLPAQRDGSGADLSQRARLNGLRQDVFATR